MENKRLQDRLAKAIDDLDYTRDELIAYIEELEGDVNQKALEIDSLKDQIQELTK